MGGGNPYKVPVHLGHTLLLFNISTCKLFIITQNNEITQMEEWQYRDNQKNVKQFSTILTIFLYTPTNP